MAKDYIFVSSLPNAVKYSAYPDNNIHYMTLNAKTKISTLKTEFFSNLICCFFFPNLDAYKLRND